MHHVVDEYSIGVVYRAMPGSVATNTSSVPTATGRIQLPRTSRKWASTYFPTQAGCNLGASEKFSFL